jgi:hypothetical protein
MASLTTRLAVLAAIACRAARGAPTKFFKLDGFSYVSTGMMVRDGFDFRPMSTMWILLSLNSCRIASSNCFFPKP